MALNIVDNPGIAAYTADDTRKWAEMYRKNGLHKPQLLLRFATDTNYVRNDVANLYRNGAQTKAMMNTALPCQRVPGIMNWSVTETLDGVVQTAQVELMNALPISQTETTLASDLWGFPYNLTIKNSYVRDSLGIVRKVTGHTDVEHKNDSHGYIYREANVEYREFQNITVNCADLSQFPHPAIRTGDVDNDVPDSDWPTNASGSGAYYILVGNEVMRVVNKTGNSFEVPPGGRGVNGVVQSHAIGERVRLLSYGPWTNEYCAMGYLNIEDYRPQKAILRPGTCLVSYEGYGDLPSTLTHDYNVATNYTFTGYWFVTGAEPQIASDGVPKIRVDLKSAGYMFDKQKITPDIMRRMKTQFGQWRVNGQTIWGAAAHNRNIPGDWVDYNNWDPSLKDSYPLKIKTELAQHKEFFEHMKDSEMGTRCEICRQEKANWIKEHGGEDPVTKERGTGRHIYKQSIRILQEEAGPIKTFIRLMATICAAAWDHPAYGTELSQKFTKIPSKLFDNIRNIQTGLVWNGQLNFSLPGGDGDYDWTELTYDDNNIITTRDGLSAPFEATYDRAAFSQPMLELAELNGATFWVNRHGYPVFKPRLFSMRPSGYGYKDLARAQPFAAQNSEWFLSYGGSIDQYSHSLNADDILTQCWVTATTAFNSTFTIACAGTGWTRRNTRDSQPVRVNYSPLAGNKEGLALTSGVQQVDSISLDNQSLGLDWNTNPSNSGAIVVKNGEYSELKITPPLYPGEPNLDSNSNDKVYKKGITAIQKMINFFLVRHYISPYQAGGMWWYQIAEDGKFGVATKEGVRAVRRLVGLDAGNGVYTRGLHDAVRTWFTTNNHYIKFDVWWYVVNGRTWEEYIATITGVPIPLKANSVKKSTSLNSATSVTIPEWIPDQKQMQQNVETWHKTLAKGVINAGNRAVDDALDKATLRSIGTNLADPRIQPGDVIWAEIPGFLGARDQNGDNAPPFTNGIYVTAIQRSMDPTSGVYTATYSGFRFRGDFANGLTKNLDDGYAFID